MKARTIPPTAIAVVLILAACGSADDAGPATGGAASITEAEIAEHLAILASDEFGGRAPSSPGEELTVAYLAEQFEAAGLEPANDGSWFQNVPLVDITADPERALFSVTDGEGTLSFDYADDFVTWTTRVVEASGVEDSDLVFVGYGIVAPEAGWDDYEGVDVTGKTAVILVNDPGFATQDPDVFSGNTMTYYGRWTYKFEEAARQGAAAALIVHQTAPAAYGWETVRNSWTGPQFNLQSPDGNAGRVAIEGWITEETTRTLFERAGLDFDALAGQAQAGTLRPVELGLSLTTSVENALRFSDSRNVVGMIEGVDELHALCSPSIIDCLEPTTVPAAASTVGGGDLRPGGEQRRHPPGLERGRPGGVGRGTVGALCHRPEAVIPQVVHERFEQGGGGLRITVHPEVRRDERPDEPRPHGALVVRAVPDRPRPAVPGAVRRLEGRQRPQPV